MSLNEASKRAVLTELEQFLNQFVRYKEFVLMPEEKRVAASLEQELQMLCLELQRKYGSLKAVIEKYGSSTSVRLQAGKYEYEAFTSAFGNYKVFSPEALELVLGIAITAINTTIGKLQSLTLLETSQVQVPEDSAQMANFLFDEMQFHPKVVEASRELFKDGHYRDAIYRAFVEVVNFVKRKAKSQLDGKKLMSTVFSPDNPKIRLNPLETQTDKDEQEGFMYLFMGAVQGIRNPKAHENIIQNNPYIALQLIGFANLLIQTISFWEAEDT